MGPRQTLVPLVALAATAIVGTTLLGLPAEAAPRAGGVEITLLPVGDVGNKDDYSGFGGVDRRYSIGRYEVTIGQYVAFLNAVAATDPHGLYSPAMAQDPNVAGITRTGSDGAYAYAALDNGGDSSNRPVTYVSWFDAARFANWMANGQPAGPPSARTTEDGAYPVAGRTTGVAPTVNAVNPNTGRAPSYRLPTEDEWYKAGYYDPAIARDRGSVVPARNRVNPNTGRPPSYYLPTEDQWFKAAYYDPDVPGGRYWTYATRSDQLPGNVMGPLPNQANYETNVYAFTQAPEFSLDQNYLTDVGAFTGSASPYGTFDQNGNLFEWNDLGGTASYSRGFRGGSWQNTVSESDMARTDSFDYDPLSACDVVGIRLAGTLQTLRGSGDGPVRMSMVKVGNGGNRADRLTGLGAVRKPFAIGRYEVTIAQYADFLNAVAASDPHGLFNPRMTVAGNLAGIVRSGTSGSYRYTVMDNSGPSGNRPIGFVDWYDAARFANWMANGQPTGAQDATTTEDGAYRLTPLRRPSTVVRPGNGGYYVFPTQSNETPGNVVGPQPNQANYANAQGQMSTTQQVGILPGVNYLTDVGAFTASSSHYGTFDQIGNVYEWNDGDGTPSTIRVIRGSCWFGSLVYAQDISKLSRGLTTPDTESNSLGFRLAGP